MIHVLHQLYLDNDSLCIVGLDVATDPEVTVEGLTVSVHRSNGDNVTAHVIV